MSRVALYLRVSTADQTTANQARELHAWAGRAGHTVVAVFEDHGISGAKGRDKRPAFDRMLKAAVRREFDQVAVWSVDRLGRSMVDLIEVLRTIAGTGVGLYIHTQALDTATPAGKAMFQMLGVFGEFERELIQARVISGVRRAQAAGKHCGRPALARRTLEAVHSALISGAGVREAARIAGCSPAKVSTIRSGMVISGQLA